MDENEKTQFDQWAVVELFGHQQIAGRVSEQTIAGQGFIRVDVPETSGRPGFTRMFGPGAIYSIIPTSEDIATRYASNLDSRPISPYMLTASKDEIKPDPADVDAPGTRQPDDDDDLPF